MAFSYVGLGRVARSEKGEVLLKQLSKSMSGNEFSVRNASADDLDTATRLGGHTVTRFSRRPTDFSFVFAPLDPTAFYVGELNGEIISYIVAVKYPGHSAFLSTQVCCC